MGNYCDVVDMVSHDDNVIAADITFLSFFFQLLVQYVWWDMVTLLTYNITDITHDGNYTHLHNGGINA